MCDGSIGVLDALSEIRRAIYLTKWRLLSECLAKLPMTIRSCAAPDCSLTPLNLSQSPDNQYFYRATDSEYHCCSGPWRSSALIAEDRTEQSSPALTEMANTWAHCEDLHGG